MPAPSVVDDDFDTPEQRQWYNVLQKGSVDDLKKWNKDGNYSNYFKNGLAPIHVVAMSGREEMDELLKELLDGGVDVNCLTEAGGDTALHLVIRHNHISLAWPATVTILGYYPDLFIRNKNLRTPYDIAVAQEFFDLSATLDGSMLPADAKALFLKSVGELYAKTLLNSILNNDEQHALWAVRRGANCNYINEHGAGPVHYIFTHYEESPMVLLTEMKLHDVDLNLKDHEGDTPLNLCIKNRKLKLNGEMPKLVAELVRWGALSTFKDLDGKDAMTLASERNYLDIVRLLKKDREQHIEEKAMLDEMELIHRGLKDHEVQEDEPVQEMEISRRYIFPRDKDDPDPVCHSLYPSLMAPLCGGGIECLCSLDWWMRDAADRVTQDRQVNEPEPEREDTEELSDLENLAGGDDTLQALLDDPEADLNQPNEIGLYPIHLAVMNEEASRRKTLIRILMERGVDINAQAIEDDEHDQGGNAPIHIAVWRNHYNTVKQILSYKPDYLITDSDQKTARDIAVDNGFDDIVELLDKYKKMMEKKEAKKTSTCSIL